ncbi:TIR-NBS-LRR type disease resistance protein [Striga asiatica]|uniref:TIR-NBS-LRR type disease resistance protein n=1 Tax=Striga asiatica TaxID=4170 RepID=A0A5A7PGY1_STRAF|nr:TIR-NBS-LRR type disease resistance protein [Striga asiatica]
MDNEGAISLVGNLVFHSRTKYFEIDLHFIREKMATQGISVRHIPALDQVVDLFTKPISSQPFTRTNIKSKRVPASIGLYGTKPCNGMQPHAPMTAQHRTRIANPYCYVSSSSVLG